MKSTYSLFQPVESMYHRLTFADIGGDLIEAGYYCRCVDCGKPFARAIDYLDDPCPERRLPCATPPRSGSGS